MQKILNIHRNPNLDSWLYLTVILVSFIAIPLLYIGFNVFSPINENFIHISKTLLPEYISNTLIIAGFSSVFAGIIGFFLAWLIVVYDFPLRSFFEWSLVLPLTIPTYIAGFVYADIFSFTGIVTEKFGLNIDIMNTKGTIAIFTLFLFPYVFLISKSFLSKISVSVIEAAKTLGKSNFQILYTVLMPLSRGALVSGISLVILEVFNSYGLVSYFGINTFSTGIFRTWFSLGDSASAIKLAAILMLLTFIVLTGEKRLRGRKSFAYASTKIRPIQRTKLNGLHALIAIFLCFIVFFLGFLLPIIQLFYWSTWTYKEMFNLELIQLILNSFSTAAFASVLIIIVSIVIVNTARLSKTKGIKSFAKFSSIGYSIPGSVIAVGVLMFFIGTDNQLDKFYMKYNLNGLYLSTTFIMLITAYVIRFLAVSYNSIESGFDKIGLKYHEASRVLGNNITKSFFKVEFPLIKSSVISAFILVFIEIIKELPLTLILRPFNFNTLATMTKQYAEDEMIYHSAIPSLVIIFICFLGILYFNNINRKKKRSTKNGSN